MARKISLAVVFCLFLFTNPLGAESKKRKLWNISAAVLGAITIADVHSSLGRHELNPLLRNFQGRFSSRGVSVKAAIVGGSLAAQWLLLRRSPEAAGYAAGANFAVAAATGAVVSRNYMVK